MEKRVSCGAADAKTGQVQRAPAVNQTSLAKQRSRACPACPPPAACDTLQAHRYAGSQQLHWFLTPPRDFRTIRNDPRALGDSWCQRALVPTGPGPLLRQRTIGVEFAFSQSLSPQSCPSSTGAAPTKPVSSVVSSAASLPWQRWLESWLGACSTGSDASATQSLERQK